MMFLFHLCEAYMLEVSDYICITELLAKFLKAEMLQMLYLSFNISLWWLIVAFFLKKKKIGSSHREILGNCSDFFQLHKIKHIPS